MGPLTDACRKCHYGPQNSACITFNTLAIMKPEVTIQDIYEEATGLKLDCTFWANADNMVCPHEFN